MIKVEIRKKLKGIYLNINFSFEKLKNVIFGPSGSGKSSILKMIAGFFDPDDGIIKVDNEIFFDKRRSIAINKRNIGYLPQEYTLFPHLTVEENALYGIKVKKLPHDKLFFDRLVNKMELRNCLDLYPNEISGGQKQRVALLRSLLIKPRLFLMDEPFSALDRPTRDSLRILVEEIIDDFGIPTIFVTHDIDEAYVFADDICLVKDGEVLQCGEKKNVFERPISVEVAKLLNFKNIWPIEDRKLGFIKVKNVWFQAEDKNSKFCCIRPENVLILRGVGNDKEKGNRVVGFIESIHFYSSYTMIKFKSGDLVVFINAPKHIVKKMKLSKGKSINIYLKKESMALCG